MKLNEAIKLLRDYRKGDFVDDDLLCRAIDTVVAELDRQELHKEMILKVSTKEYGEDGIGLSKEDLSECLYK